MIIILEGLVDISAVLIIPLLLTAMILLVEYRHFWNTRSNGRLKGLASLVIVLYKPRRIRPIV